jgi:hypothetical protein
MYERDGHFYFSGYGACGDPLEGHGLRSGRAPRPFDAVVEIGRSFFLTHDGQLYLTGPGSMRFQAFSADDVHRWALLRCFGFRLLECEQRLLF